MSSLQSAEGVIKPWGNVLNVERASTSTSMSKGKKGKKKKPSAKGPKVGPIPKIAKSKEKEKGRRMARAKELVSNVRYLATGRGTAQTS